MCFSAEASFAASGVLATTSVAIARLPKERAGMPLSVVPAIFAAHQFAEGLLWLHHGGHLPDPVQAGALWAYTFIAYVLWPIFVPYAAYRLEAAHRRRAAILACQGVGLATGLVFVASLVRHPVTVSATCCGLFYDVDAPAGLLAPYLIAVSIPFLVSSRRYLPIFGVAVALSCGAAAIVARIEALPSVWCFFAAALSAGLYLYFWYEARVAGQETALRGPWRWWLRPGQPVGPD